MEPEYYFVVQEFLTTFGLDPDKTEPLDISKKFKKSDFHNSFKKAYDAACYYYYERLDGLERGHYFLPFAGPREFIRGENAAFSITVKIVIDEPARYSPTFGWGPPNRTELYLIGETPEEMMEGNELLQELLLEEIN